MTSRWFGKLRENMGGLRWNGQYASYWVTETDGLNSNTAQYRCSDDQTKEGVEDVEALIFMKPKGALDADYELVDIVKASIKIDNDEKKKIVYIPLVEVLKDTIQGTGENARITCMGRGVAYIPIEKDAIRYSARAMGTGTSWEDAAVYNWNAGTKSGLVCRLRSSPRNIRQRIYPGSFRFGTKRRAL